jgi:GNAT superfamily N-acetyltransferase
MEIRPACREEVELLAEIQRAASVAGFAHIFDPSRYPFPIDSVRQRWREALDDPGARVSVAEIDGKPAGLAGVHADWLDGLYVVPELWGQGVGRALHDHALDTVRGLGSDRAHLWVLEHNHRARRFYGRLGWRPNDETRVVPFPPNPLDVGYTIDLKSRLAER